MKVVPLGEAFLRITNGKNVPQDDSGDGLPVTRIETIANGRVNPLKCGYAALPRAGNEKWILQAGDILMSHINSPKHVGKCAIYEAEHPEMIHGMNLLRLEPDIAQLDSRYAFHQLRSRKFRSDLRRFINQAVNQASVSISNLKSIDFILPPLDEQQRIAAILDKADELRAKRREALAHLETLTQSIFHSMFGDPVTNPKNLPRLTLPEVGHLYSGGTPSKASSENWGGDVPWFSPKDIKAMFLTDSIDHISSRVIETSSLKLLPAKTVVLVVRGMILAHSFPVAMLLRQATINQDLKAIRPTRPVEPEFLLACLQAQHGHAVSLVETAAHGTKKLTADGLSKIYVFDVPLELQQTFAIRVAAVEGLKEAHRKHLAELDALFASLQHRAFKGEL
ncbi:hypothetical protein HC744_19720 [Arthrobacter sp. S1_S22]|nr:hypothetical protein [Arthrobacter sp. S1_S22]